MTTSLSATHWVASCSLVHPTAAAFGIHFGVHVPGVDNNAADALSRPPQLSCLAPTNMLPFLNTKALSAAQSACSATVAVVADPCFQVIKRLLASGHVLLCSTSTGMDQPLLPPGARTCFPEGGYPPDIRPPDGFSMTSGWKQGRQCKNKTILFQ